MSVCVWVCLCVHAFVSVCVSVCVCVCILSLPSPRHVDVCRYHGNDSFQDRLGLKTQFQLVRSAHPRARIIPTNILVVSPLLSSATLLGSSAGSGKSMRRILNLLIFLADRSRDSRPTPPVGSPLSKMSFIPYPCRMSDTNFVNSKHKTSLYQI